jgi:hypothetical protein
VWEVEGARLQGLADERAAALREAQQQVAMLQVCTSLPATTTCSCSGLSASLSAHHKPLLPALYTAVLVLSPGLPAPVTAPTRCYL